MTEFLIEPIGVIRSDIKRMEDAPLFYTEGAPNVFLELTAKYMDGLDQIEVGKEIIVVTWLHRARRDVLKSIHGVMSLGRLGEFS